MKQKSKHMIISTGVTSMVLIFVLLCLLTFSVLSFVSANANMKLSRKHADHITSYHNAENAANDILLQIISAMDKNLGAANSDTFYKNVQKDLTHLDSVSFLDENHLTYKVNINEHQYLNVSLTLSFPSLKNGTHYIITTWNTNSSYNWNEEHPLPLLKDTLEDLS